MPRNGATGEIDITYAKRTSSTTVLLVHINIELKIGRQKFQKYDKKSC